MPGAGSYGALHVELVALAEPARDRRDQLGLPALGDVQESGRARPGVEVLVGAADRELGAGGAQADRQRAGRVREVPDESGRRAARQRAVTAARSSSAPVR